MLLKDTAYKINETFPLRRRDVEGVHERVGEASVDASGVGVALRIGVKYV